MNLQTWIDAAAPFAVVAALSAGVAQLFTNDDAWMLFASLVGVFALATSNQVKASSTRPAP